MNKYGYLIIFLLNIALSFYTTELSDFSSLIGLFALYLCTTVLLGLDWGIVSFRIKLPKEDPLAKSAYLLTHIGDRIMFLAIIAVSDIVVFAISLSDASITFLENALHLPVFIVLLSLFLIPWLILYLFSYRYLHISENLIYTRFRTAILTNAVQIPAEILPYFIPGAQLRSPPPPKSQDVPKYTPQNQGPVLYAYPNSSQELQPTTREIVSSKESATVSTYDQVTDERTRILELYNVFLHQIYPELQPYLERTPVAIQDTLILTIVAQRLPTDPELLAKISSLSAKFNF